MPVSQPLSSARNKLISSLVCFSKVRCGPLCTSFCSFQSVLLVRLATFQNKMKRTTRRFSQKIKQVRPQPASNSLNNNIPRSALSGVFSSRPLPFPSFPTDTQLLMTAVLSQHAKTSLQLDPSLHASLQTYRHIVLLHNRLGPLTAVFHLDIRPDQQPKTTLTQKTAPAASLQKVLGLIFPRPTVLFFKANVTFCLKNFICSMNIMFFKLQIQDFNCDLHAKMLFQRIAFVPTLLIQTFWIESSKTTQHAHKYFNPFLFTSHNVVSFKDMCYY